MKQFLFLSLFSSLLFSEEFSYGPNKQQTLEIFSINSSKTIFLVHGGAWKFGNKSFFDKNKTNFFNSNGFNVVSINYRLLPEATVQEQLEDIKFAILSVRKQNLNNRFYLIGHSAGAHLSSLLNFDPDLKFLNGVVSLDFAALNVLNIMNKRHFPFYDEAFGSSKENWINLSPFYQIPENQNSPMLLVCSENRNDSCPTNYSFIYKMTKFDNQIISLKKSHSEISSDLGKDLEYSNQILNFLNNL